MSYEHEMEVHINTPRSPSYGYPIEFKTEDKWGNRVPLNFLSGVSGLCFEVVSGLSYRMWRDCNSGHFTVNNPSGGLFEWIVQSGFFNQLGVFEGKLHAKFFSGMRYLIFDDLRISVVGRP